MENDFFKRIAIDTAIDRDIVKKVIDHSLDSLLRNVEGSRTMEITGWGTFYLRERRLPHYVRSMERQIEELKEHSLSLTKKSAIIANEERIERVEKDILKIKKIYGVE